MTRTRGYETTRINGRRHLVCASCRLPLVKGHNPPYPLPEPGMPSLTEGMKQAVCGPCYKTMFAFMYPDSKVPDVFDGRLEGGTLVSWDGSGAQEKEPPDDDFAVWERALQEARDSDGAETVAEAYHRLSGLSPPDVTITAPPPDIEPAPTEEAQQAAS